MNGKIWLTLVIVCVLAAGLCGAASAAILLPEDTGRNYSMSAGLAFPISSSSARSSSAIVGIKWYGAAGGKLGETAVFGLSVDWMPVRAVSGDDVNVLPVLFNYGRYSMLGERRMFLYGGVGIIAADGDLPELCIEDGAQFGWQVGGNVEINDRVQAGVRFIAGSHPADDGFFVAELGYRF